MSINVLKMEFVIPDTDGNPVVVDMLSESDPRPTVHLDVVGPQDISVNQETGQATMTLTGYVLDALADNATEGYVSEGRCDIDEVQVYVNGAPSSAPIAVVRGTADEPASFFKQNPYKGVFESIAT